MSLYKGQKLRSYTNLGINIAKVDGLKSLNYDKNRIKNAFKLNDILSILLSSYVCPTHMFGFSLVSFTRDNF